MRPTHKVLVRVAIAIFCVSLLVLGCQFLPGYLADRAYERELTEIHQRARANPTQMHGQAPSSVRATPTRDWSVQKQKAKKRQNPALYAPVATRQPTPIPYSHSDFALCQQFREEMAFARSKGWTFENLDALLSEQELADAINMNAHCNRVMSSAYPTPTFIPQPTLAPTTPPTSTPARRVSPEPLATPAIASTPLTRSEIQATLTAHRTGLGLTNTPAPSPIPTPMPIPFTVSDGESAIPLIEKAWELIDSRKDANGIYFSDEQLNSMWWGIQDYYALDFERRCLTERGTLAEIDRVVDLDYPGNTLYFPDSRHTFHSGASSFSDGDLSNVRRGDWKTRAVEWTLYYPPGLGDNVYGDARHYIRLWAKVDVATCALKRDSYSGDFYSVMPSAGSFVRSPKNWECIYQPLREEELAGRDHVKLRSYNCALVRVKWR